MFMPEGVSPASMFLMAVMHEIFEDFLDWMIGIHDNILVLCSTHEDAYDKLVKVIERCKERNRYLKIAKSNFGINKVNSFGSYSLSEEKTVGDSDSFPLQYKIYATFSRCQHVFQTIHLPIL
jgi:hypothetical protein